MLSLLHVVVAFVFALAENVFVFVESIADIASAATLVAAKIFVAAAFVATLGVVVVVVAHCSLLKLLDLRIPGNIVAP